MNVAHHTYPVMNRDQQVGYLMIADNNTVIFYGYDTMQITSTRRKILAVDPNGGPMFSLSQDIRPFISNGNPLQLPPVYIYSIENNKYCTIFKTSDIEEQQD